MASTSLDDVVGFLENGTWIDVSRPVHADTVVWPGDTPFSRSWMRRTDRGDTVNLSSISLSVHTATHLDAPLHVDASASPVDVLPIAHFVGQVLVIDLQNTETETIHPDLVQSIPSETKAVFFKTRHSKISETIWDSDWLPIDPETVSRLSAAGVVLVGTDAPSVDPQESKTLPAHRALAAAGMLQLEGLRLSKAEAGAYLFVALPLRIEGSDASPVRVVLFKSD